MPLLQSDHPQAHAGLLWVLETAVALRDGVTAGAVVDEVEGSVQARAARGPDDEMSVRLRAARADHTGDWESLVRDRSGRLGPAMGALALARHARISARTGRDLDAETDYQLAIQRACTAGTTQDAAAYLRANVQLSSRFGRLPAATNELLATAADLARTGTTILKHARDPLDAGAAAIAQNSRRRSVGTEQR